MCGFISFNFGLQKAIVNIFTSNITKPSNEAPLLDINDKGSKAYSANNLAFDREFWSTRTMYTPVIELLSSMISF